MARCRRATSSRVEAARGAQRMQPRAPERLVGVDVPEPGDGALVEERRLERRSAPASRFAERAAVNAAERLGAEPLREVRLELVRLEQQPRAEAAHVAIGDVRSVV